MNHCYQVIRSKKLFVVHEYMFSVLNKGYAETIEDLNFHIRKIPKHFVALAVIHTNDGEVCRQSAVPTVKPKDIAV